MHSNDEIIIDISYDRKIRSNETIEIRDDNLVIEGNDHFMSEGSNTLFDVYGTGIVFRDMTFRNFDLEYGALIYNESSLRFENCRFLSNSFDDEYGIISNNGHLEIVNCLFEDNSLFLGKGSCIINYGTVLIKDSKFINNKSEYGGAIYNKSKLDITGSIFQGNTSEYEGGAIYNESRLKILNSIFIENKSFKGGAICNENCLLIRDSSFENNIAGGSNHIENCKNAHADILNTNFKDK